MRGGLDHSHPGCSFGHPGCWSETHSSWGDPRSSRSKCFIPEVPAGWHGLDRREGRGEWFARSPTRPFGKALQGEPHKLVKRTTTPQKAAAWVPVILWLLAAPFVSAAELAPLAVTIPIRTAPVDFVTEVRPLLQKNCVACHNAKSA